MAYSNIQISKVIYQRRVPVFVLALAAAIIVFASASECQAVTLTITANNGSVTATPHKADYNIGELVELVPRPDTGYYFSGWAGDAHGKRLVLDLTMDSDKNIIANFDIWQPPIGIPDPPFGITTTHMMYADPSYNYDYGSGPEPYRIGPNGPYTHYVDPGRRNATDQNNPYGTHTKPRVTVPHKMSGNPAYGQVLPPGTVFEIHGGPYGGSPIALSGTASLPIFIRGVPGDEPTFTGVFTILGDYVVMENLKFDLGGYARKTIRIGLYDGPRTNIAIRGCEFYNGMYDPGQSYQVIRIAHDHDNSNQLKNIVIYNNHFHNIGDGRSTPVKRDAVGVSVDTNAENIWIVDNHMHHIGGDGVQIAYDSWSANSIIPNHIYVGRNTFHDNYENAVDLKGCEHVIISQNTAYNFGEGYCGLAGVSGSYAPFRYGTGAGVHGGARNNIWTLFNAAYNYNSLDGGFASFNRASEVPSTDIYFIGNIAYNAHNDNGNSTGFGSLQHEKVYWINNTAYNCDRAGAFYGDRLGTIDTEKLILVNNIFGDIASGSNMPYSLQIGGVQASLNRMVIKNNVFYNSSGNTQFRVGVYNPPASATWSTYSTYPAFRAAYPGLCTNSIESNPNHVNPANGDFRLRASSTAIDAGTSSGVVQQAFDTFQTLYGIDIRQDIEGNSRPQGIGWDIGAHEHMQGPALSISSTTGGVVTTPGEGSFQYGGTTIVPIDATPAQYYSFVNWTGTAVTAGQVANPTAASTTVTVDSGYTLVANFDTNFHTLTVSSSSGGSVTSPGEGSFLYGDQVNVPIRANAASHYHFVNWRGTAVNAGKVADPASASTTVTIDADYTLRARFSIDRHNLTTSSTSGGTVTTPGEGTYAYNHGASASVVAAPSTNYHFVNWTGTAVDSGKVANANSTSAAVTMDGAYSIQANFALDRHTLTVSSTSGGSASTPGEGPFQYDHNANVSVQAVPANNCYFVNWTGTAVNAGKVANPNSASTAVTVDAGYTIRANFGQQEGSAPTISQLSPASGSIQAPLDSLIILHVTDAGIGVDARTVQIKLHDVIIYTGDVSSYNSAMGTCRRAGTPADYTYAYQSNQPFDFDELKAVTVNASDIGGVAMAEQSYSFRTEMRSFGQNEQVSSALGNLSNGTAATVCDSSGNIWAVWHAGPVGSRDIYLGKLAAGAAKFGTSVRLTTDGADQVNPAIAVGIGDKLYVVWQDNRRGNWDIYGSTSTDGTDWSWERRIADVEDDQNHNQTNPAIAADANPPGNDAYVVYQDDRSGNQDIYLAMSNRGFETRTVSQVTSNSADQTDPAIAVNSSGTVYVLWTDARNTANGTDIYGAAGSSWANVPVVRKAANQSNPAIAVESSGSVLHMLWVDRASDNGDIYYASSNRLPRNPLAGRNLVDDTSGAAQLSPTIAVSGTGGSLNVFACWQDERNVSGNTGDTDIYMVQADSGSGTNVFVGDGGTNSDQAEPSIGVDRSGYPYIVWSDNRGTNSGIYYAGSTSTKSTAIVAGLINASSGNTLGAADVQSMRSVDDVSITLPAGACPYDVNISVKRVDNPHDSALPFLNGCEFSPSGMEFNSPVTITLPYAVSSTAGTPTPYWYNSLTGTLSQQGIDNIEIIEINSNLHVLRFTTTHLTPYYVLMGAGIGGSIAGGGGGGGGGCSLSHPSQGNVFEYFLPYAVLALFMFVLKARDRRHVLCRRTRKS